MRASLERYGNWSEHQQLVCNRARMYYINTHTDTLHIQMYASTQKRKRMSQIKDMLGRNDAHIELALGNAQHNFKYCTKEDSRVPGTEPCHFGQFHEADQGKRTDLETIVALARSGNSFTEIIDTPGLLPTVARSMRFTERLLRDNMRAPQRTDLR